VPYSEQKRILPYKSNDLFNIVLDIEKYPEFLPWCTASRIIQDQNNQIIADLKIRYKLFNESFRSFVDYNNNSKFISVKYSEGPLKSLITDWNFEEIKENETLLKFYLNFEFKFNPFQKLIENFYNHLENKMINAFEKRAFILLNNKKN
tara:strand:+ start:351 stop:797 length:447 start_codon:yes stop_codon:yes gene_type:complete